MICVGEALYDCLTADPHAPFDDNDAWTSLPGGAPANLAASLAKLGTASALIGGIGDDAPGRTLQNLLEEALVNVDGLQKVQGYPTRQVFVRRDANGERTFEGFGADSEKCADAQELDPDRLPGVLFYAAQLLVTGTLGLAFPGSRKTMEELVQLGYACRLRIVVDVNWRPVFWEGVNEDDARNRILAFLRENPGADFVKASVEDVDFLFGPDVARAAHQEPRVVLEALRGRVQGVIITAGAAGSSYAFNTDSQPICGRIEAFTPPSPVVDTTGAGDAFLAGFLSEMFEQGGQAALSDEEKTLSMANFAAATAAHVVSGTGAIDPQPSRSDVQTFLKTVLPVVK